MVCVSRQTKRIRVPAATTCRSGERVLRLTVTKPKALCRATDRSLRPATTAKTARSCRRDGNQVIRVPRTRLLVCAAPGGSARWIWGGERCVSGETRFRFKNVAPRGLRASGRTVADGAPVGTEVARLSARDGNVGDRLRFRLVAGKGSADNAGFAITGNRVVLAHRIDVREGVIRSLRVEARDRFGATRVRAFRVSVTDVNRAPSEVRISASEVFVGTAEGTIVGDLSAVDPDVADTHIFALATGPGDEHNRQFVVDGSHLRTDAPMRSSDGVTRTVRVAATDRGGLVVETQLALSVVQGPVAPSGIRLSSHTVVENAPASTTVGTLTAVDLNTADTFDFALVDGPGSGDNGSFAIDGATLRTTTSFDFEAGASRSIRVEVTDSSGLSHAQVLTVDVVGVNEAPTAVALSPAVVDERLPSGQTVGTLTTSDPEPGDTHTYTLVAGPGDGDNADFVINGSQVRTASVLLRADGATRTIRIATTDAGGLRHEAAVEIGVAGVPVAPTGLTLSADEVEENQPGGTVVGRLGSADLNVDDTHTYTLVAGAGDADNDLFAVQGDRLLTDTEFDFETAPTHTVRIRTTDSEGLFFEDSVTITVTDANDAPTALALTNDEIDENAATAAVVGELSATDPDLADTHTYALVDGAGDAGNLHFTIVGTELRTSTAFDFEEQTSYDVRVRVEDAGGLGFERTFTIAVRNVNEAPTAIALSRSVVAEHNLPDVIVGDLSATDPDAGGSHTFSLVAGAGDTDNDDFRIDGAHLRATAQFSLADGATRSVRVAVVDQGNLRFETSVEVTIVRGVTAPTAVRLDGGTVPENAPADRLVGLLSALDADTGDTHTFELVDGAGAVDNAAFAISGVELRAAEMFDFEARSSYTVRVRATDSDGLWVEATFTITVTDVNEAPTLMALSHSDVAENEPVDTLVGHLSATDPDAGDTHTFALTSGPGDDHNDKFVIVGASVRTTEAFDFEARSSHSVRVRVTDSANATFDQTLTITVTDINEAPNSVLLSAAEVAEGAVVGTVVGELSAADPDAEDTHTFTLVPGDGATDNASFAVDRDQLVTTASFDFETKASYTVRLRATDARGLMFEQTRQISVRDVNEAPTAVTTAPGTVPENSPPDTVVGTLATTDPDAGDTHTFALVDNALDNQLFTISGAELRTAMTFDFEARSTYTVRVRATDRDGLWVGATLTITVTNVNEAPTLVSLSEAGVAENQPAGTVVGALSASDPDADDTHTFTLTTGAGDGDNARFAVVGASLRTAESFNFEARSSYSVRVQARDAGGSTVQRAFTITVTDVNEAPIAVTDTYAGVIGNTTAKLGTVATTGPTVTLIGALPWANDSDPDAGDTVSVVAAPAVTTALGGTVDLRADGSFGYRPKTGVRATTDTFSYTVTDGDLSTTGTIRLVIASDAVWYVDPGAESGAGTSWSPTASIGLLSGDQPGDRLFLHAGTHQAPVLGGVLLKSGQQLLGAAEGLTVGGQTLVPAGGTSTLTGPSFAPTVVLGESSRVAGLQLVATSGPAVRAAAVNSAVVAANVTVQGGTGATVTIEQGNGNLDVLGAITPGTGAPAIQVTARAGGTVRFGDVVSAPATPGGGIAVAGASGSVLFTGRVDLTTGAQKAVSVSNSSVQFSSPANRLQTTTGVPLTLTRATVGGQSATFIDISSNGAEHGIVLTDVGGAAVRVTDGTIARSTSSGVSITRSVAPTLTGMMVTGGSADGIMAADVAGTLTLHDLEVSGNAGHGVLLDHASGTAAVHVTDSMFSGNLDDHIQVAASGGTLAPVQIAGNQLTGGTVGARGQGIVVSAAAASFGGTLTYDIDDNDVTGASTSAVIVSAASGLASYTFRGRIRNNRIGTVASPCSADHNGIEVANDSGTMTAVTAITNNVVHGCRRGISLTVGDGAAALHATVTGNSVATRPATASSAFEANVGLVASDTGISCLALSGNTFAVAPNLAPGIRVHKRYATLALPGYPGPGSDPTAVALFLGSANPAGGSVEVPLITSGAFTNGTCQQPPN